MLAISFHGSDLGAYKWVEMKAKYTSLEGLAASLGLPRRYLRDLARRRLIPFLNVSGRLRFDESAVRSALERIASPSGRNPLDEQ